MSDENRMELAEQSNIPANETGAEKLARLAAEINTIKAQTLAAVQNATLEIGKRLIQAKGAVGHGNWSAWLAENVDYSERTAQNIIAIYERFGNGQQKLFGATADPEQVARLNRTQMLTLMSIKDEETCFNFMEEHKDDLQDMSKRELEAAIKELNEVKAEKEALIKESKDKTKELDETREKYQQEMKELQEQLAEVGGNKELSILKEKLSEMEKQYIDLENRAGELLEEKDKYSRLYNEAQGAAMESQTKLQGEIAKLKEENESIKNAPLEPSVIERVPEETVKEMEALKAKIAELEKAKPEKSEAERKFAHHIENLRSELQQAVDWLEKIEEAKQDKYQELFRKMLEKTIEAV